MNALLEQFINESRENLEYIDENLKNLESSDESVVDALFRAAHTLKGGAGLVGFTAVQEITHAAEDLLDAYRQHKVEFKPEMIDVLYDAFDEVVELVDAAEELGDVNVDVDESKVEEIKNSIREFLESKTDEKKQEKEIELPFSLNRELAVACLFSHEQAKQMLEYAYFDDVRITEDFVNNPNYWLVDLDLDIETLKLGNDPVYLLYLLGDDSLIKVGVKVDCRSIETDSLDWASHIAAVVKADVPTMEDVFYNIIDEIDAKPLDIDALFFNSFESIGENDTFEQFKDEARTLLSEGKFDTLEEKIEGISQILNPDSFEGFILERLKVLLDAVEKGSKRYEKLLEKAFAILGVEAIKEIATQDETEIAKEEVEEERELKEKKSEPVSNDKELLKEAFNIIKTQQKVLRLAKDDTVVERTKRLLRSVLSAVDSSYVDKLEEISSLDEMIKFVDTLIDACSARLRESGIEIEEKKTREPIKEKEFSKEETKPKQDKVHHNIPKTVKVEQRQIDELMNIVGELLVLKNALPYIAETMESSTELAKRELLSKYEQISRLVEMLQDRAMDMRLLPLNYIFSRYPKLVRDLGKKLKKRVRYEEEGGETKLDKAIIEKLADPMIHLIRNSLDHGIETEEERVAKGKDPVGLIKISARSEGDKVFITIEDDGKGIDVDALVYKALDKNLIDPDELESMSREEKLKLIFLPGLSTSDKITEISGRGVGGDAIKSVIDELGGNIYVESEKDKGTKIELEIPVSVALTDVFHVKMGGINYAIPMEYIVETDKISEGDIKTAAHKPFVKLRNELIPIVFEKRLLGENYKPSGEIPIVVILAGGIKFALAVDELVGQLDVMQKPLSGVLAAHPFISSTSLLGNGDILFILDPKRLVRSVNAKTAN